MTDVSDYVYDEDDQYTVPEFFHKYKDRLPSLVVVTGGFCGLTNYDDYSNDQVKTQLKLNNNNITIKPIHTYHPSSRVFYYSDDG